MRFYIDFENVRERGIDGCLQLSSSDEIIVLYSKNSSKMDVHLVEQLMQASCKVTFYKIPELFIDSGTKNALDFTLITLLYSDQSNVDIPVYIVSMDKGYDSAISTGSNNGFKVNRISSITDILNTSEEPLPLSVHADAAVDNKASFPINMKPPSKNRIESINAAILSILRDSLNVNEFKKYSGFIINQLCVVANVVKEPKQAFYQALNRQYGDVGLIIYKKLRIRFEELQKLAKAIVREKKNERLNYPKHIWQKSNKRKP